MICSTETCGGQAEWYCQVTNVVLVLCGPCTERATAIHPDVQMRVIP